MTELKVGAEFDGETYDPEKDKARLTGQLLKVYDTMKDGHWVTLRYVAAATGASEASVSARIRDLRKEKFGGFTVERKRSEKHKGLWHYRIKAEDPKQLRLVS
jgi:biotin operon repressor